MGPGAVKLLMPGLVFCVKILAIKMVTADYFMKDCMWKGVNICTVPKTAEVFC